MTAKISEAMAAAAAEIAKVGVGKTGRNQDQKFNFRPVDEVLNTVGPILARHGIALSVEFCDRESEWVAARSGGNMTSVVLTGKFTFNHDGESLTTTTIGEARDTQDKATNKAMAMATKYALVTAFAIPVIGSDDTDAGETPEASGSMTVQEFEKHSQAIDAALTKKELRSLTSAALKAADAAGDTHAREALKQKATKKSEGLPEE